MRPLSSRRTLVILSFFNIQEKTIIRISNIVWLNVSYLGNISYLCILIANFTIMDKLDNIGKLFGQRRIELGMTQAEVGERMGVGRATISKIESGKGLTFDTINRMANALDADVNVALTPKAMHGKEVIEYIVTAISEFAKRYVLTIKEASNYLLRFKGIEFLEQCYAAEHTLSVRDWVDDITAICKRNGGGIG